MPRDTIQLTEGEWAIMRALWDCQPCAAPTVQEALQKTRNWSYSTVRTIMDRMVAKGLLTAEKIRNLTLYRAVVTPGQAQHAEVVGALQRAFNGATAPMVQCLLDADDISVEELAQLEKLIREKRRKAKS
jgi:BlaI family penicillinase repressor